MSISASCFITFPHNEILLLGQLVSLQSSYWWWKNNQKNSHKGLQFSGEPPRCLMPFYSVPTTTITLASEQLSPSGVPAGPWLDLLVVRLNMEFAEPNSLPMKHQKIGVILKCSFGLPTSLRITLHLSWRLPHNSCWFIGRGERCNVLLWLCLVKVGKLWNVGWFLQRGELTSPENRPHMGTISDRH